MTTGAKMSPATGPDEVVRALRPAALDMMADEAYARRRDGDLARAMRAGAAGGREPVPARGTLVRRRPLLLLTGVAAAGALVVGAAVAVTGQDGAVRLGPGVATLPDAREFLLASARTAEKAPAGTGRYWYIRSRDTTEVSGVRWVVRGEGPQARKAKVQPKIPYRASLVNPAEVWIGTAPGDVFRKSSGRTEVAFASAADEAAWRKQGAPNLAGGTAEPRTWEAKGARLSIGERRMSVRELRALPADRGGLEAVLRAQYERDRKAAGNRFAGGFPAYVWEIARDLLAAPLTPGTKGALFKILAAQPGIWLDGAVKDRLGRPGTALSVAAAPDGGAERVTTRMIVSSGTGALLEYETRESGFGSRWMTYAAMGWVGHLGAKL
ncbi:hypothetical protein ACQP1W_14955 [Spirillospora sp. CA-255316]